MSPNSINNLIGIFSRLPGIGPKVAERIVYYLLMSGKGEVQRMAEGLHGLLAEIKTCEVCQNFAAESPCPICADSVRDRGIICVVAMPGNIPSIEKTGYKGVYHVLRGVLDPTRDISPMQLTIEALEKRTGAKEVILALNPDIDGEATMLYLEQRLKDKGYKISRLARGIPLGSDIEFADEITLGDAFANRKTL